MIHKVNVVFCCHDRIVSVGRHLKGLFFIILSVDKLIIQYQKNSSIERLRKGTESCYLYIAFDTLITKL